MLSAADLSNVVWDVVGLHPNPVETNSMLKMKVLRCEHPVKRSFPGTQYAYSLERKRTFENRKRL